MSHSKSDETAQYRRFIRIHGKLYSKSFTRKTDADRWYIEKKREKELAESGVQAELPKLTVREYSERWMVTRKAQGKPESSWLTDGRRLRLHILNEMGDRILHQITRREWEEFLESLVVNKKLNPSTRNRVHALISKMYRDALRQDLVVINPMSAIPKLRESQNQWDYWHSLEECSQYLREMETEGSVFWITSMLALNTGARVGEILALQNQDVQLEKRRIHIWRTYEQETRKIVERTKGKGDRWLGINEALYQALKQHGARSRFQKPTDLIVSREDGAPSEEWIVRNRHYKVCERAGIKTIRFHDLRHTYASHYVMNGGSLADLQSLMGHSSGEMTRKYAHLTPGHLESKSGVISFGGQSANEPHPDEPKSGPRTFENPIVPERKLRLVTQR